MIFFQWYSGQLIQDSFLSELKKKGILIFGTDCGQYRFAIRCGIIKDDMDAEETARKMMEGY